MTGQEMNKQESDAALWLRSKYGAYRGHFAWPELEEAFNAGQAAIASREPMTETQAMAIVGCRPQGSLVNSLHYAIRSCERFHGIGK